LSQQRRQHRKHAGLATCDHGRWAPVPDPNPEVGTQPDPAEYVPSDATTTSPAAALDARTRQGLLGRFFDGPPPTTTVTAWQTNGGLAIEVAAAGLAPGAPAVAGSGWAHAIPAYRSIATTPALTFSGEGVALLGTLGQVCCESRDARPLIDGRETFDHTGIRQSTSRVCMSIPDTVLLAWR
jgi:hypothetical protein